MMAQNDQQIASNPAANSSTFDSSTMTNDTLSLIEQEAYAAIREVAPYVNTLCISGVLHRTPEMFFFNLLTKENKTYCVELTVRGWRICSDRHDCKNGDFRQLDLYIKYYETIYQLLNSISPEYRRLFAESLSQKLSQLPSAN